MIDSLFNLCYNFCFGVTIFVRRRTKQLISKLELSRFAPFLIPAGLTACLGSSAIILGQIDNVDVDLKARTDITIAVDTPAISALQFEAEQSSSAPTHLTCRLVQAGPLIVNCAQLNLND